MRRLRLTLTVSAVTAAALAAAPGTSVASAAATVAPPPRDVITVRGKELAAATVADARALFVSGSVQLIPVLDGSA